MTDKRHISKALEDHGFRDPGPMAERLDQYMEMLQKHREWAGLTSRGVAGGPESSIDESLALAAELEGPSSLIDIGAGGGLLGMVIAIVCPDVEVVLLESLSRKAAFLAEAIGRLRLENARVINKRAEKLLETGIYDYVTSRAAGKLVDVAPVALRLLKSGGRYLALKSADVDREISEAIDVVKECGGGFAGKEAIGGGEAATASLVLIQKL
jgi:16S rRNA (guanine527-N7)-methyltransferase